MNTGVYRGNSAKGAFNPDRYYTGYWGPFRQLSGLDSPGQSVTSASLTLDNVQLSSSQVNIEVPNSWTVIASELPFDAEAFEIHPRGNFTVSGGHISCALEVAYGAVGHETVVLERFYIGARQSATSGAGVADVIGPFPIKIPAGSRVVMRSVFWANTNLNTTITTQIYQPFFYRRYPRPGTKGLTLPLGIPNTAVRLSSPGGADTDSSFSDVGVVPFDTHWVVPCPMVGSSLNAYGSAIMVIDYAYVDGAGSDVVFADNIQVETNSSEWQWNQPRPIPVNLPAGTLIRARGKYENTGFATFMVAGLTCIGVEDVDPARRPGQSQIVG